MVKYIANRSGIKNPVCENMASIPETLAESKLFGHKKGAFTGATDNSTGLFEQAHGGILFMDEMGEASKAIQAKILRVLQEKEVVRVGENLPRKIDFRFIAGTHCDLEKMITEGNFREDLYYRLNSFIVKIPPLRERKEDIMFLATQFLDELNSENSKNETYRFSNDAEEALLAYPWPGNIRELNSFIKTINVSLPSKYLMTKDDINKILERKTVIKKEVLSVIKMEEKKTKKRTTKEAILSAFEKCAGNKTLTAESLGIDRATVHRALQKAGIA